MKTDLSSPAYRSYLAALRNWADSPQAEMHLQSAFGATINWASAYRHLEFLKRGDFSLLPRIEVLRGRAMEALWGGYSRDLRVVFLSSDCPENLVVPVLLEEIGHFFDQEFCEVETPGDEGALFAALVLGTELDLLTASEDDLEVLEFRGKSVAVEAARKVRGSRGKSGKSSRKGRGQSSARSSQDSGSGGGSSAVTSRDGGAVYSFKESDRIAQGKNGQRLIGTSGNDTFAVSSQDVTIQDPGGTDTVETPVSFSLENFGVIENLVLTGSGNIAGTGNFKANVITGNSGNNVLDGGKDSEVDILMGGAGDDSYVLRDTLDQIVEAKDQGSDTILTTINNISLTDLAIENVENLTFTGEGSATLSGNALANVLTGGKQADTLFGSEGDTLIGWQGDDVYYVSSVTTRVLELDGALDGNDTISTGVANYSMAASKNVEALIYTGSSNSTLTGNTGNNSIYGALIPRNTINGGDGDDYLFGGDTTDSLVGGKGDDTLAVTRWVGNQTGALGSALRTNRGNDTLNGGEGNDWYIVDSQTAFNYQDTLGSNTIASTVDFSLKYNANISANIQNLYLIGGSNLRGSGSDIANSITGNDGGNNIAAGAGDDTVYGGLGADLISGEAGNDTLIGGGQPQTDLAADASTPVEIQAGQTYTGKFELRFDEDWVKVAFNEGETYTITLTASLSGNDIFKENSWIYLGDPIEKDGDEAYGDTQYLYNYSSADYWWGDWWSYNYDGYDDNKFQVGYKFTAFDAGEFYLPVAVGGPSTGSYTLNVQSNAASQSAFGEVLADNGQNTIIGGLGNDFLVAGNGRDTLGAPIGDILLGGKNGIPGSTDLDSSTKQNITASLISKKGYYKIESLGTTNWSTLGAASQVVGTIFQATLDGSLVGGTGLVEVPRDSLIGGAGGDLLDAGNGMDLMIGGSGNDTYFVDYPFDIVIEEDSGGRDDIAIFSHGVTRTLTGAAYDVNLSDRFTNVEHASLVGSANLHVFGNSDPNSLHGNFGNNLLNGHAGNDSLLGQGGNDYLVGGDGGDFMDGGSGQNTMDGGLGDDTYIINDRSDRIVNETLSPDGGIDLVRTYFNFDPIQGSEQEQFQPNQPDNSPSRHKAPSFASKDLESFYNLENFELLGEAVYGVGNALGNSLIAGESSALLLGMGGEDSLIGNAGDDTLFGDTPEFYASPDLYAPAPTDTRTKEFMDGVVGSYGSDYLEGGAGNDYLDGGRGFDTMIGGDGSDTFVQDHTDDYVVATGGGGNELISSVNIAKAPDDISRLMLVVKEQERDVSGNSITGQDQVASFASFLGTEGGNDLGAGIIVGTANFSVENANTMELLYGTAKAEVFSTTVNQSNPNFISGGRKVDEFVDPNDNTKVAYNLSWSAIDPGDHAEEDPIIGYTVSYRQTSARVEDLILSSKLSDQSEFGGLVIEFLNPKADNQPLSVTTEGLKITALLATDSDGDITTTYSQLRDAISLDAEASALVDVSLVGSGSSVVQENTQQYLDVWRTYVLGSSQDFQGTTANPTLVVDNLDLGAYEFKAEGRRRSVPVTRNERGNAAGQLVVTLQGGAGNDQVSSARLIRSATPLQSDAALDPYIWNNILDPLPLGFLFAPLPVDPSYGIRGGYAAYLDGGFGNDLLCGWQVNDASGLDYTSPIKQWSADGVTSITENITFRGLNTLVGGQGSDTFIVRNGGLAIGDEFDWVIKYGNETPVNYGAGGLGNSLNGGQHNVIASAVRYLTLSDTEVHQGMFIDQVVLTSAGQFAMGNRLDNFLSDGLNGGAGGFNTLVGNTGRDSIHGAGSGESTGGDVLIGGTAYGVDNVGFAIRDFASVADGGNGLTRSIFRDTDPIPTNPNGPGTADPSQFWSIPGFYKYGEVFDFSRNRDTLVAGAGAYATLDGGAGRDSLVGSETENKKLGDNFFVSAGAGEIAPGLSKNILMGDAVFGNGGNDTVTFTDSDYLWWGGHEEGSTLDMKGYTIAKDISNLVLQMGAPTARNATGNKTSTGYQGIVGAAEEGSNLLVGNEFDNILDGGGVGGENEKGVGIDTLTGGAGSDLFIVSGYIKSAGNKWPTNKDLDIIQTGSNAGRYDLKVNDYTDADYVVITDFEAADMLNLDQEVSAYWIGAAPSKANLEDDNVKPKQPSLNEFGIYKSAAPSDRPNLVAHVKLSGGYRLNAQDIAAPNQAFAPNNPISGSIYENKDYAGWGTFYNLGGSIFAANVNQPYTQQASTASLSDLMGRIEII